MPEKIHLPKSCVVMSHFDCNGTGQMCGNCGEAENVCQCDDESNLEKCVDCDGTGRFCTEHESPCGDLSGSSKCDKIKQEDSKK